MEEEMNDIIAQAKLLMNERQFGECEVLLSTAMFQYPHSAVPHNLMGLLLEKKRQHENAMKHFRAANALDPSYGPARWNLDGFAEFYRTRKEAYSEDDCDFSKLPQPYKKESSSCI
jgi:hypothetical protein